jgi:RimJ/RimL family protein N-acetyltransferase
VTSANGSPRDDDPPRSAVVRRTQSEAVQALRGRERVKTADGSAAGGRLTDQVIGRARFFNGAPLPVLRNRYATLRELRIGDAAALLSHISPPEVLRHISPAPTTTAGFASFIRWTKAQRRRRLHAAFGLIPAGGVTPVGILQVWPVELDWSTAEWGFVMGQPYWGTGLFTQGASLLLNFAFHTVGVKRLEARSGDVNGRGNRALQKIGAIREGTLRQAFRRGDEVTDHVMWSMLADEWGAATRAGQKERG